MIAHRVIAFSRGAGSTLADFRFVDTPMSKFLNGVKA